MSLLRNIRGATQFFSLMVLLVISSIFLNIVTKQLIHINDHLSIRKSMVCLSEYNRNQSTFINKTNWANRWIRNIAINSWVTKIISITIPGLGLLSMSAEEIKTLLKRYQDGLLVSYLKKNIALRKKQCSIVTNNLDIPYHIDLLSFKRTKIGTTQLRSSKWSQQIIARKATVLTTVSLQDVYQIKARFKNHFKTWGLKGRAW